MMRFFVYWPLTLVLLFATNSAYCAHGDAAAFAARYPAGSIQTVEQARKALDDVELERKFAGEDFLDAKDKCLKKFFVSSCLDKAKEVRRKTMNSIRAVEVEANAYLRREKAAERDRNVAERMRKAESVEGNRVIIPLPDASNQSGKTAD